MKEQRCSYFNTKGGCKNPAELMEGTTYAVDFCAMHNHMEKAGLPVKCWRCGDKEDGR